MRRSLVSVLALVAPMSTAIATKVASAPVATATVRLAGPTAFLRSADGDGRVVIVGDGAHDRVIDRTAVGPPLVLAFQGGLLSPDGAHILYAAPDPSAPVSATPPLDVFRYDFAGGTSTLLTGGLSDAWSYVPTTSSADAAIVGIEATRSGSSDRQVLVLDTVRHTTTSPAATLPPGASSGITVSLDGGRAAFSWLGADQTSLQLYVYDGAARALTLVTSSALDVPASRRPRAASISGDGGAVVYLSDAGDDGSSDLEDPTPPDSGDGPTRVLLYDVEASRTVTVARSSVAGVDDAPSVSADGTRVAFLKMARTDLPGAPGSLAPQLFVRDLEAGETRPITAPPGGPNPTAAVTMARLTSDGLAVLWNGAGPAVYAMSLPPSAPCTISGGPGADALVGTARADVICGLGGDDTIRGLGGDDTIRGGAGHDVLSGGSGNDHLQGGDGNDSLDGGAGNDVLRGGAGRDDLAGGNGDDTIDAGEGNDVMRSGSGRDVVLGGRGNDVIDAGTGDDRVFGGDGNDVIEAGAGADGVDAGTGDDIVRGSAGDDAVYGRAGRDSVNGLSGADRLYGGTGNDTLDGGSGNDRISAGDGNDTASGGSGDDDLRGGSGADVLRGNGGTDALSGDDGRDQLDGGAGTDALDGGADADVCRAGGGPDRKVRCEK